MRLLRLLALLLLPLGVHAQTLTVSAAASLTDAFKEIGARFDATKGSTTRFNFAASGVLIQQILQGAPVDVFVSADQQTMDRGIKEKVLDGGSRKDFAANTLVLVAPVGGVPVSRVEDLAGEPVKRVAIGKLLTVPVGRYTKEALDSVKLWAAVEPKLVYADSVRQVLDYVARGEADAGFVYRTDAELMKDKLRIVATVGGHSPVSYPAATVTDSKQAALAKAFVDYLSGAEAQAILARYGFSKP